MNTFWILGRLSCVSVGCSRLLVPQKLLDASHGQSPKPDDFKSEGHGLESLCQQYFHEISVKSFCVICRRPVKLVDLFYQLSGRQVYRQPTLSNSYESQLSEGKVELGKHTVKGGTQLKTMELGLLSNRFSLFTHICSRYLEVVGLSLVTIVAIFEFHTTL